MGLTDGLGGPEAGEEEGGGGHGFTTLKTGRKVAPFTRGPACGKESFRVGEVGQTQAAVLGRVDLGSLRATR